MLEQNNHQLSAEDPTPNLPARIPSASLVLHRTQTMLGLLRDIVQEGSADYWYGQGRKAIDEANWEQALYSFQYALNISPAHWRCEVQLAYIFAEKKAFSHVAASLYKAYEGLAPHFDSFSKELTLTQWECIERLIYDNDKNKNYKELISLALAHYGAMRLKGYRSGDGGKARTILDKLLTIKGKSIQEQRQLYKLSSCLWLCQDELLKASADVERAIKFNNQDAYCYFTLGCIESQLGDLHNSVDAFNKAISINKYELYYYGHRANVLKKLKDYNGALADMELSLKIKPDSYGTHDSRLELNKSRENWRAVIEDADWLISFTVTKSPGVSSLYFKDRAHAKELLGDLDGAAEDYREANRLRQQSQPKVSQEEAPF